MYFDFRLWRLTAGFRGRMALGTFLGLLALGVGIARFAFLGIALAAVFDGHGPAAALPWLAAAALAVLARALLDQRRANIAHRRRGGGAEQAARAALRQDRGPRPGLVRRAADRRRDAVDDRRRRAVADLLRPVPAAAHRRRLLRRSRSSPFMAWWDAAGRRRDAGRGAGHPGSAGLVHTATSRRLVARQQAFKAFGAEFLDAVQGLPTLKAFGQSARLRPRLAEQGARRCPTSTFWVLGAQRDDARHHRSRHRRSARPRHWPSAPGACRMAR